MAIEIKGKEVVLKEDVLWLITMYIDKCSDKEKESSAYTVAKTLLQSMRDSAERMPTFLHDFIEADS